MNEKFKALSLSAINASGTSQRALYSALATEMFFGQKSVLEIRVDKGIVKPYFTVPMPALESLNSATKKELLLIGCLEETAKQLKQLSATLPLNTIEQVIITTSYLSDTVEIQSIEANSTEISSIEIEAFKKEWQQIAQVHIAQYLPRFSHKTVFNYAHTPALEQSINPCIEGQSFEHPVLVINIDSLLDYNEVKKLSNLVEVQCLQGPAGIMPSEAATSTLLIPDHYPEIADKKVISVERLNPNQQQSIKEQLTKAKFTLPSTVVHVGTISEQWTIHWYGQTNSFYHQKNNGELAKESMAQPQEPKEMTLYDQTKTLGYLGVASLTTAFASVTSLLFSPLEAMTDIWLVEHQVNAKNKQKPLASVYKITPAHSD